MFRLDSVTEKKQKMRSASILKEVLAIDFEAGLQV